jgi:uncharacterized protein YbaR (Trm112 family)
MDKPRCTNCDTELEHEFEICPNCGRKKVVSSSGLMQMESLSGVERVSQLQQEALQRVIKIISIPMENQSFSSHEQNEIGKRIDDQIPELLEKQDLNPKQLERIKSDIEYIKDELKSQKKEAWYYIFQGIAIKWILDNILTEEIALTIYDGIKNIIIEVISNVG